MKVNLIAQSLSSFELHVAFVYKMYYCYFDCYFLQKS